MTLIFQLWPWPSFLRPWSITPLSSKKIRWDCQLSVLLRSSFIFTFWQWCWHAKNVCASWTRSIFLCISKLGFSSNLKKISGETKSVPVVLLLFYLQIIIVQELIYIKDCMANGVKSFQLYFIHTWLTLSVLNWPVRWMSLPWLLSNTTLAPSRGITLDNPSSRDWAVWTARPCKYNKIFEFVSF